MITGKFFVGSRETSGRETYRAFDAATGAALEPPFHCASVEDVDRACALAALAFDSFREASLEQRARLLEAIADNLAGMGDMGDELIRRAMAETALPRPRLEGERARTINQLRFFAGIVRRGTWLALRIDTAQPERTPRRPDLRLRKIPIGPVAVFGASNFPLAFSVAGGDTASALAAGCPVVVRGHPAHPGVAELAARAVAKAVADCELPAGVFSFVTGPSHEIGRALVANPDIKAAAFTGSRAGGLALAAVAAARPEPIPMFAEMSSVNPVFLLPGALEDDAENIAKAFVASLTLGAGQFCTNPGLVFAARGADLDRFIAAAADALSSRDAETMLTAGIHAAYEDAVARLAREQGVEARAHGRGANGRNQARAALFVADGDAFKRNPELAREVFGPSAILVRVERPEELLGLVDALEGQLTGTMHLRESDFALASRLLPALERKAGRIIANGWPTGVEVAHAMVHGGPFPATSDSRTTSVGSMAIERFLRPVCYQDVPGALLPETLRDGDAEFERLVDGVRVGPNGERGA
ncbi:MAG TPA: aldehyde dehydrogenase (NADP(+)) [Gammaproteobacteria bacterium]|nr:aldehyde dehydrogenase (NADP(+)) [Gammaproteobacteria bacterium]